MRAFRSPLIFFLALGISLISAEEKDSFVIQTFGEVDPMVVDLARSAVTDVFGISSVEILPAKPLPESAYYKPRNRYRAEKLLVSLDALNRKRSTKIVGLTSVDISTTKGPYEDWGIFGMANLGGPSCVISTYRLGRKKVDPALFAARVKKVVTHEFGHILGLPHCSIPGCVMQDAQGKISTIDQSDGRLCADCQRRLGLNDL